MNDLADRHASGDRDLARWWLRETIPRLLPLRESEADPHCILAGLSSGLSLRWDSALQLSRQQPYHGTLKEASLPHILIADCWDTASQQRVMALGTRADAQLFEDALKLHDPSVCCVSMNVAERETLSAGVALGDFDGVMLTGSPLSVCDQTEAVRHQIDFARAVFTCGIPVWGSCYGLQLATVALGGAVRRNPNGR